MISLVLFHGLLLALGMQMDALTMGVVAGIAVVVLGVVWFGLRYWLAATKPASIDDVPTPTLDRLNQQALEHMAAETAEQDEAETKALADEEAPADLKAVVPDEEPHSATS